MSRVKNFVRDVWVVAHKELIDAARDRRSLASAMVFALFGPLVVGLALSALQKQKDDDRPLQVMVAGGEHAPALVAALERGGVKVLAAGDTGEVEAAIATRREEVALVIAERTSEERRELEPLELTVVWDRSWSASSRALTRLEARLAAFETGEGHRRLLARGISPRLVDGLTLERHDVSTAASRAATALAMVPIFLLMATFIGGMNVAIDVTAGERERGSLEPLLLPATSRAALAAGKWLAAVVPNLGVVAATLAVTVAVVRWPRLDSLGLRLEADAIWSLALLLLPLALFGPALQMLAALFSTSYKEAQTHLSLLVMLPAVPGFLLVFRGVEPAGWWRLVPLAGQQIAAGAALRGEPPAGWVMAALGGLTLVLAFACVGGVAVLLGRERTLAPG